MFVIPCFNSGNSPIVDCVKQIRLFHPYERVVIVDSSSPDKSYFDTIRNAFPDVEIDDVFNRHYCDGAIWHCYEKYKDEQFFFLIHDTMFVTRNIDWVKENEFTSIMWFNIQEYMMHTDNLEYAKHELESKTKYTFKTDGQGLFGISFCAQRSVLDKFKAGGLHNVLPSNKHEMMQSERIWGIALQQEGYDFVKQSILGNWMAFRDKPFDWNRDAIVKTLMRRE